MKLRLKKQNSVLIIRYKTFEKATYDQYLIASLIKYSNNDNEVENYINEITGKGSLNSHFKSLYKELSKLEWSSIDKILNDCLYPILKVDKSNYFMYYPELNISIMKEKIYKGSIKDYPLLPKQLLPKDCEFFESDVEEGKLKEDPDMYYVTFDEGKVSVDLKENILCDINEDTFNDKVESDIKSMKEYKGTIFENVEGNNWKIISTSKYNDLTDNDSRNFIDKGNHYFITNKYVKKTRVAKLFGLYLFKESIINYQPSNRKECILVLNHLKTSGLIETIKIQTLIEILKCVDNSIAIPYIDYLLDRKQSQQLTNLTFEIIKHANYYEWSSGAIQNLVSFMKSDNELLNVYKIAKGKNFAIEQKYRIYQLNRKLLTEEDFKEVKVFIENREAIIKQINMIIGEITNSGRREKTKKIKNDPDVKKYRLMSNKYQGHVEEDIKKLNFEGLKKYLDEVMEYKRLDDLMKRKLEELIIE